MRVTIVMRECEFSMELGSQETILEIKQRLQQSLGVPTFAQTLTVCGLELIDGLDMEDYPNVIEGTKIVLSIKENEVIPPYQREKFQLFIKFSSRKLNMEVDTTETVRSLKEKIHIVDGTPIKRMSLFFCGRELDEDFRCLSEYGIRGFSEIVVFLKSATRGVADLPSRVLNVVVETSSSLLNAAKIPLEVSELSCVSELRELLVSREILPKDDYIFIHKQRIMRESCSLRWHGVENNDFLYVFRGSVSRGE